MSTSNASNAEVLNALTRADAENNARRDTHALHALVAELSKFTTALELLHADSFDGDVLPGPARVKLYDLSERLRLLSVPAGTRAVEKRTEKPKE